MAKPRRFRFCAITASSMSLQCEGITVPAPPEINGEFHPIEKCEQVVAAHAPSPGD